MRRVLLELPMSGDTEVVDAYARRAVYDALMHDEAPFAPSLLYAQAADERELVDDAVRVWGEEAEAIVVYVDLGVTSAMEVRIDRAEGEGKVIEYRTIGRG